jgi:hypothetical protein
MDIYSVGLSAAKPNLPTVPEDFHEFSLSDGTGPYSLK